MTYEDCFKKGLLRRGSVSKEETEGQIKIAESYISKAEKIMDKEVFDMSFLAAYISIFHSARALLYSKGHKERSHFCLFEFVRNEFKDDAEIVRFAEVAQNYRETRRLVQYEGSLCSEHSAREAINDAKNFLKAAKNKLAT
jgi:uncharacterized protein (UPF0332 family)